MKPTRQACRKISATSEADGRVICTWPGSVEEAAAKLKFRRHARAESCFNSSSGFPPIYPLFLMSETRKTLWLRARRGRLHLQQVVKLRGRHSSMASGGGGAGERKPGARQLTERERQRGRANERTNRPSQRRTGTEKAEHCFLEDGRKERGKTISFHIGK